jgi:hypothetical protein
MIHLQVGQTSINEQLDEENRDWSHCGVSTACFAPTKTQIRFLFESLKKERRRPDHLP